MGVAANKFDAVIRYNGVYGELHCKRCGHWISMYSIIPTQCFNCNQIFDIKRIGYQVSDKNSFKEKQDSLNNFEKMSKHDDRRKYIKYLNYDSTY